MDGNRGWRGVRRGLEEKGEEISLLGHCGELIECE